MKSNIAKAVDQWMRWFCCSRDRSTRFEDNQWMSGLQTIEFRCLRDSKRTNAGDDHCLWRYFLLAILQNCCRSQSRNRDRDRFWEEHDGRARWLSHANWHIQFEDCRICNLNIIVIKIINTLSKRNKIAYSNELTIRTACLKLARQRFSGCTANKLK